MSALVARARGLATRALDQALVDEGPVAVEHAIRVRAADDYAVLARWRDRTCLDVIELDEDRRTVRAIVRGLVGGVSAERRRASCVTTSRLPERVLGELAAARNLEEVAAILRDDAHPFATALGAGEGAIDLLVLETALTRAYVAHAGPSDPAARAYLTQIVDSENAVAALELAARGRALPAKLFFIAGGERLDARTFTAAATSAAAKARDLLAAAFARTPLASALASASLSAIDDATLTWQLATQRALRRTEPHGLAPVLYLVLQRRHEARRLRRAAWRRALAGGSA